METYRLHGGPGLASMAPEAVLEELVALLGVPYEFVESDAQIRRSADYLKLNPFGQVPTLVHGDHAVWEAAAICIYLCDRHPEANLAPSPTASTRGTYLQWMLYLSNTLHPAYMAFIQPGRHCTSAAGQAEVKDSAAKKIASAWKHIDDALTPGPFLCGAQLTAADMYVYMLSAWHRESIVPLASFASLQRNIALVDARPGVQKMMVRNRGH